jgi:hypothetical protein
MTQLSGEQNDWNIPCSDDENYGVQGEVSINFCALCLGTLNWLVSVMQQVDTDMDIDICIS